MVAEHNPFYNKMKISVDQLLRQVPTPGKHQVRRSDRHLELPHKSKKPTVSSFLVQLKSSWLHYQLKYLKYIIWKECWMYDECMTKSMWTASLIAKSHDLILKYLVQGAPYALVECMVYWQNLYNLRI